MKTITRHRISACRICKNPALKQVIHFDAMPFTDEFVDKDKIGTEFLAPIEISVCENCGSAQNRNDTDMGDYYADYTYSVQSSGFAVQFMQTLATRIKQQYYADNAKPVILEIGSGTGEQLMEFQKLGFSVIGIEPSEKLSAYANSHNIKTLTSFFDEHTTEIMEPEFRKVDAIVTSYTFDHIPRPVEVLKNIHDILNDDGLLIIEVHDLELIRKRNEFCLFEHEHYTYLDETTMTALLNNNSFKVETFTLLSQNEKRANSLLVVARKTNAPVPNRIDAKRETELLGRLATDIKSSIQRIEQWIEVHASDEIVAYGAGGRGIMTIAALKNAEKIRYIVDKNPKRPGIYAPKSHLPVHGIEMLGTKRAGRILVFSFGYYSEIVKELGDRFGYRPDQFTSILDLLELSHA